MPTTPEESHVLYGDMRFRKIIGRLGAHAAAFCMSTDPEKYEVAHHVCWEAAKEILELQNKVAELEAELAKLKRES